jgi:hypothetical protein
LNKGIMNVLVSLQMFILQMVMHGRWLILNHLSFCGGSSRKNHTGETNVRIVPTPSKLFYDKEETGYRNVPRIRKNSTRNLLLKTEKIRSYSEQGIVDPYPH